MIRQYSNQGLLCKTYTNLSFPFKLLSSHRVLFISARFLNLPIIIIIIIIIIAITIINGSTALLLGLGRFSYTESVGLFVRVSANRKAATYT
jgi:hypothetical protein